MSLVVVEESALRLRVKHTAARAMMAAMRARGCHIGDKCRGDAPARPFAAETGDLAPGSTPD
jgi:hypothetical protein